MARPQGFGKAKRKAKQRQGKPSTLAVVSSQTAINLGLGRQIGIPQKILQAFDIVWILGEGDQ